MCNATELRAVDLSSSHQIEEVIGAASSENELFIAKMEFSVRRNHHPRRGHREQDADDSRGLRERQQGSLHLGWAFRYYLAPSPCL